MIDIKSVLLMTRVFQPGAVALVALVVAESAFLAGLVVNYFGS
jgi:uncharacterized membrane protein YraQ (UPF0718 family)